MDLPYRAFRMTMGVLGIASGIVVIITFGQVHPNWPFNFARWRARRQDEKDFKELLTKEIKG